MKKKAMPELGPISAAYLAGLIDGEGCIGIYNKKPAGTRKSPYHQLQVGVAMREPEGIGYMAEFKKGYHSWKGCRAMSTGMIHEVKLYGRKAAAFLKEILPYLKVKRRQAQMAIEFYEVCKFNQRGLNHPITEQELARRNYYEMLLKAEKRGQAHYIQG